MREVGVEPTRLSAQEPKSCASANSATRAEEIFPSLYQEGKREPRAEKLSADNGGCALDLAAGLGKNPAVRRCTDGPQATDCALVAGRRRDLRFLSSKLLHLTRVSLRQ